MRKLKLQMQVSLDGFVGGPRGFNANWNDEANNYSIENLKSVDCIVLSGKVGKDFVPHWAAVGDDPALPDHLFGKRVAELPKIVFSNTLKDGALQNTTVIKGDLTVEINKLKNEPGKDLLVYGGASFASNLIKANLVDEYHLLVNPFAMGTGMAIFNELRDNLQLRLVGNTVFNCGTVVLVYQPAAFMESLA
jgi:dihydrofolate reductase